MLFSFACFSRPSKRPTKKHVRVHCPCAAHPLMCAVEAQDAVCITVDSETCHAALCCAELVLYCAVSCCVPPRSPTCWPPVVLMPRCSCLTWAASGSSPHSQVGACGTWLDTLLRAMVVLGAVANPYSVTTRESAVPTGCGHAPLQGAGKQPATHHARMHRCSIKVGISLMLCWCPQLAPTTCRLGCETQPTPADPLTARCCALANRAHKARHSSRVGPGQPAGLCQQRQVPALLEAHAR